MIHWHPLFTQLLRPVVEPTYELRTAVPVGDAPRAADLVLLRRTEAPPRVFHGLWRHLTAWNVLEFKGRTVTPRPGDLDLLVELGLGIHRRLNEEQSRLPAPSLGRDDVSFWYLANRLGRRFLREADTALGPLTAEGPGLWRCEAVRRRVYLVSSVALPIDEDSLPLHLVGQGPPAGQLAMAQYLMDRPALFQRYHVSLLTLHPDVQEEVLAMARTRKKDEFDFTWLSKGGGLPEDVRQAYIKNIIAEAGPKGVIEELGPKRVVEELGVDNFLANLTPAQLREVKQRLK